MTTPAEQASEWNRLHPAGSRFRKRRADTPEQIGRVVTTNSEARYDNDGVFVWFMWFNGGRGHLTIAVDLDELEPLS